MGTWLVDRLYLFLTCCREQQQEKQRAIETLEPVISLTLLDQYLTGMYVEWENQDLKICKFWKIVPNPY